MNLKSFKEKNLFETFVSFAITVIPIVFLTFMLLISHFSDKALMISVLVFPILTLFQCRLILMIHDLGHQTLFTSLWANQLAGIVASILTLVPSKYTACAHSVHHQFNGNWAMYKGPMYVVEVGVFKSFNTKDRFLYLINRRMELIWITAVLQNLLIPRLRLFSFNKTNPVNLILFDDMGANLFKALICNSRLLPIRNIEFIDTLLGTIISVVLLSWLAYTSLLTAIVYVLSIVFALSIITIIFHVNHNFPGSYATTFARWDKNRVIAEGTSNIIWNPRPLVYSQL